MNSVLFYKWMSKCYDLLDFIYFHDNQNSPRKVTLDSINRHDRILDICTGTATNAIQIAMKKTSAKIVGIDISEEMLTVANNKLEKEHLSDHVKLVCGDATVMPFDAGCFDKVLLSLVLHEMDEALAGRVIKEAIRVLHSDGRILVTEWEPSKVLWRKLLFFPVHMLEPKTYHQFVKKDLYSYFRSFDLEVEKEIHCNYSRVLILKKNTSIS